MYTLGRTIPLELHQEEMAREVGGKLINMKLCMWLTEESSAKKGVVNNVMSVRGCRKMNIGEKPLDYKCKLGCQ